MFSSLFVYQASSFYFFYCVKLVGVAKRFNFYKKLNHENFLFLKKTNTEKESQEAVE